MKITDREALAAAENLRKYCRKTRRRNENRILKKAKNKARQHGNADGAQGESWNRFTSILTRRE